MYFIVKPKNIRALLGTTGNELSYYERVFVKNRCLHNSNRTYAVGCPKPCGSAIYRLWQLSPILVSPFREQAERMPDKSGNYNLKCVTPTTFAVN